jgi:hypothetical protein
VLCSPLHGDFVELHSLSWDQEGVTRAHHAPLETRDVAGSILQKLPTGRSIRSATFSDALYLVCEVLWRHLRRHGQLPDPLSGLAALL